jgi:hypothetical protein
MKVVASAAAIVFLLVGLGLQAQEKVSLTDFESSSLEGDFINPNPETNDIAVLKENILLQNERIKVLTDSLISSNNEAEICRQELNNIQLLNSLYPNKNDTNNVKNIESKLLQCLNQLSHLEKKHEQVKEQLIKLLESIKILTISSSAVDPQARASVEEELRKTNYLLNQANKSDSNQYSASLQNASIINKELNLGLIVANIGKAQKVAIGMPFQIFHNNKLIGLAKVIDARNQISGLVIQNLTIDNVQPEVGDILKVDAKK